MGSLFATKQKTKSSGTQQGTTESNYWDQPGLQEFLGGYNSQYSGPNISQVQAPVNSWQTGAVANQSGLPGGLGNAFGAANTVATNGIDPNRINAFMSPYIQSVVNPTIEAQNQQNQGALSNLRGNSATRGALGNNTGQSAAYMAGVAPAQNAAIANLYNTGFNQAAGLTTADVNARLQGAGAVGNLTGVNTGANTAQFGMGETMRNAEMQNQMTPFQLWNQGLAGQLGFGNLAGQNTSGTTTGTQTQTQTPGLGQSLAGIAGMGMSLFGGGGMFPGLFSGGGGGGYTGGGSSSWAANGGVIRRNGGAVKGYNDGGSVLPSFHGNSGESFADKVARAHETVSKLRASGGRTEKKEEPRTGQFSPRFDLLNRWAPTVTEERGQDPFMNPEQAQRMMAFQPMRPMQYELSELRGFDDGGTVLPETFQPFQGFDASNSTAMQPGYVGSPFGQFPSPSLLTPPPLNPFEGALNSNLADDGVAPADIRTTGNVMEAYNPIGPPRTASVVPTSGPVNGPTMDPNATASPGGSGRRQIEAMHPHQRLAAMLMSASGPGVLGPGGRALIDMHQQRIAEHGAELQADQLAQQLAHQNAQQEHQRAVLAETIQHNRNTEANRAQNRPETAYQVGMANAAVKDVTDRSAAIRNSTGQLERLGQMETLINDPNVRQGSWANWELEGKKAAQALGFNMQGVPESEALRALSNQIALQLRNPAGGEGMPGAMSDADRNFLVASVPGLTTTDAGNRALIRIMTDKEKYRIAQNREAIRYVQQNHTNDGLEQHMQRWAEVNPMISRETRQTTERAIQQAPQQPAATAAPQAAWTRTPPENQQRAIADLRKAVGTPELKTRMQQFNATFNNGQPGLAESLVQDDESQAFRERENPDLNAPHNMLRRWFGQPPVQ